MLGWGLVAATVHPGSYTSEMSLTITACAGDLGAQSWGSEVHGNSGAVTH